MSLHQGLASAAWCLLSRARRLSVRKRSTTMSYKATLGSHHDLRAATRLILGMAAIIFVTEGLIMVLLANVDFSNYPLIEAAIDAGSLTAIAAPLSYFILLKPFILRTAAAEAALSSALETSRAREKELTAALADAELQKRVLDQHCSYTKTDTRGRIIYTNDQFIRMSGYSREEIIGRTHGIVNSGTHPKAFWANMIETLKRDGVWQGEVCNRKKDGSLYWVQATNVAEKNAEGKLTGYFSVRSDITPTKLREEELGKAQTELRRAIEIAEAASRAKSGFLSTMSHEMRTPLNGVLGALQLLDQEGLTERQKDLVERAKESSEALLVHINDVLDFSKLEADKLDLDPQAFDLVALLNSVSHIVEPQTQKAGNTIRLILDEGLPKRLSGDAIRLKQVLLNLVSNAAKFTRKGEISVSVARIGGDDARPLLEFAVRDTGIGIPEERLNDLFREFSMVDSSYTRRTGGTGLGLAISKRLIEMMGGEIGVSSQAGVGSRFWFRLSLPCANGEDHETSEVETTSAEPVGRFAILLVDDNRTNRFVTSQLLLSAGHSVVLASSGKEAVDLADRSKYDAIFMDISMPDMDGLEATRMIRSLSRYNADTPIVALTAHAVVGDRERFLARGMNGYLAKPVRLRDIARTLAQIEVGRATPQGTAQVLKSETASPVSVG
ncbi:MAG: PAS domain-containing hybrid sensor histidine kinase/response regulator [Hyphomicrobium sp.]|nr:MAG: PAS domain-containing hybrid sensor histidine kinase/response regulator [Hyphomicrobium sp.]